MAIHSISRAAVALGGRVARHVTRAVFGGRPTPGVDRFAGLVHSRSPWAGLQPTVGTGTFSHRAAAARGYAPNVRGRGEARIGPSPRPRFHPPRRGAEYNLTTQKLDRLKPSNWDLAVLASVFAHRKMEKVQVTVGRYTGNPDVAEAVMSELRRRMRRSERPLRGREQAFFDLLTERIGKLQARIVRGPRDRAMVDDMVLLDKSQRVFAKSCRLLYACESWVRRR
ncbi:MAG: hypothetical protein HYT76_00225 [Deltaproteobacteria bacterium]|nr:hypothetical protein [Deltaproteobacteria bacterium]